MKVRLLKAVNPKLQVEGVVDLPFEGVKVNDEVEIFGDRLRVTQIGEIFTLVGYRGDEQVLYVFQREYDNREYIEDYRLIREGEDLIVDESRKVIYVRVPMAMEAVYKFFRYRKDLKERVLVQVKDDLFVFVNGWRFGDEESAKNIKKGSFCCESKILEVRM